MGKISPELYKKMATLVDSMGYELFGGESLSQGRRSLLRLFIDKPEGVTVEDCARVSRQIDALLAVEQPHHPHGYALEVSSPGINRSLFEIEHYKKYRGNQVKIYLNQPIEQRRHYNGLLREVIGEDIYLQLEEGKELVIPFSLIEKANLMEKIRIN